MAVHLPWTGGFAARALASPGGVLFILSFLVWGVFQAEKSRLGPKLFKFFPALVWVYFLPMLATTVGLLPKASPVYKDFQLYLLPGALLLLLATADLRSVKDLGLPAVLMFFAGSVGIFLGALASLSLLGPILPHDAWKGFGALAGSWIGGSANMVGLQAVFETPPGLFGQMVVVDTVVGYTWIGLLISLAPRQKRIDRFLGADRSLLEDARERVEGMDLGGKGSMDLPSAAGIAFLGLGLAPLCMALGGIMPEIQGRVNHFAWGILAISLVGVFLSFTPVRRLKDRGADQVGYAGIYLMLAGVGAQADLSSILGAPALVLAGALWISIHALVLLVAARLLRAPLFFLAVGSTANIGGPASAPLVATVYRADLAPVGLILAVLGNTVGYYLGYLTGEACRFIAGG